jgi:hypothetical protein
MASTYLSRSVSTTGNRRTWTFSAWVKRSNVTQQYQNMFAAGSNNIRINFSNQNIWVYDYNGSSFDFYLVTNRLFRDTSAWYHIVVAVDTTQATSSDRVKLYINGVQETSFSTETYPSQNHDTEANTSGQNNVIGTDAGSLGNNSFDGSMSHVNWIDGTAYTPSAFGETDATTGEWTINTSPSVTYGTNGFFILKDSGSVTDQSGNGNNFTVAGGTLTDTLDCPGNVFATWNPLSSNTGNTYSNGNTTVSYANNFQRNANSTLAFNSGKYYGEFKRTGNANLHVGIVGNTFLEDGRIITDTSENHTYNMRGHTGCITLITNTADQSIFVDGSDSGDAVDFFTSTGDIVMVAFDEDTKKIWFGKNGTWSSSGNPSTGANPSYTYSGTATSDFTFGVDTENGSTCSANFGNGYFGTTAVASAGTNASGIGIFEYDVPTGFTALSTKGLNL